MELNRQANLQLAVANGVGQLYYHDLELSGNCSVFSFTFELVLGCRM